MDTILLSNLHCGRRAPLVTSPCPTNSDATPASCVSTIQETLAGLSPAPTNVHVSIVASVVTFERPKSLSLSDVVGALERAGFDVAEDRFRERSLDPFAKRQRHTEQCRACQLEEEHGKHTSSSAEPQHDSSWRLTLSIGGMTCASCTNTVTNALSQLDGVSDVAIDLIGSTGSLTLASRDLVDKVITTIDDSGYEGEVVDIRPLKTDAAASQNYRIALSVSGMTCSACVNTITDALRALDGVQDVTISLLTNSASLEVSSEDVVKLVLETIDDIGYEATVVSITPPNLQQPSAAGPRSVALRVDGMFCNNCPKHVVSQLKSFVDSGAVTIVKPIVDLKDPIIELSYTPSPPEFTIRTIISAVARARGGDQVFNVSIHKPPTLEERSRAMHAREQRSLLMRLLFAVVVAIPTFVIGIVYMSLVPKHDATRMWFMQPMWAGNASRTEWALFFLATPVYLYSAGTFHRRALKEIIALWRPGSRVPIFRRFLRFGSMNLLISAGTTVAFFASIALLVLASTQSRNMTGQGDLTTYFDSVVFLTMFLLIGRYMEAYSKGRTADAITALGKLRPSTALLVEPQTADTSVTGLTTPVDAAPGADLEKGAAGAEMLTAKPGTVVRSINVDLLEVHDVVRVLKGSTPPADGVLVSSSHQDQSSTFDESALTGESKLVKKNLGDEVFLGTINQGSVVDVRVTSIGGQSMLDKIVSVVREGQTKRAPIERVADRITAYFVPVVTFLAIITWIIWLSLGLTGSLPRDYLDVDVGGWPVWSLEFAIAVFVVACPCGIGLAAPTALLVGSGLAARFGILVRGGGEAFQEASQIDLLALDKTGTITRGGEPKVTDWHFADGEAVPSQQNILEMVLEMENTSTHPIALALQAHCRSLSTASVQGSRFEEVAGKGLKATFESLALRAIIGNEAWMAVHGAAVSPEFASTLEKWKLEGKSVVVFAVASLDDAAACQVTAAFAVSDPIRPEAASVLRHLQQRGISLWMISGDNEVTAKTVAKTVGIAPENVIAGVLPQEKAEKIRWLQSHGQKRRLSWWKRLFGGIPVTRSIVGFVGDGINDAPALAIADLGIAIGSGSDVAISSASFVLVSSNLRSLLVLCDLSKKVISRVKFNFFWALVYNVAMIPIAAGVIYPAGHTRLDPVWASLAMALSSVSVVCSSLLLKLYREPRSL